MNYLNYINSLNWLKFDRPKTSFAFFNFASFNCPLLVLVILLAAAEPSSFASSGWESKSPWGGGVSSSRDTGRLLNISPFAPGSNNLSVDLGQVLLMGDLNKYSDTIGTQIHYTYGVSELFGFDSSLGFSNHSNGNFSLTTLVGGLRTNLSWYDKIIPYIVFGFGFYMPNYKIPSNDPKFPNNTINYSPVLFGVHLGPGMDLEITQQFFFGASLTLHDMFATTDHASNGQELKGGGTYSTLFIHGGVTF